MCKEKSAREGAQNRATPGPTIAPGFGAVKTFSGRIVGPYLLLCRCAILPGSISRRPPTGFQPVPLAIHFEHMDPVGQAVQKRPGHPFIAQDLRPLAEGQVGGHDQAGPLVAAADEVEQVLRRPLTQRHVTQLVHDDQVAPEDVVLQPLQVALLPGLGVGGSQADGCEEAHLQAPPARLPAQGDGQMSLAHPRRPDHHQILPTLHQVAARQVQNPLFAEPGDGLEVKPVQFHLRWEPRPLETALYCLALPFRNLYPGQARQKLGVILVLLRALPRRPLVLPDKGRGLSDLRWLSSRTRLFMTGSCPRSAGRTLRAQPSRQWPAEDQGIRKDRAPPAGDGDERSAPRRPRPR